MPIEHLTPSVEDRAVEVQLLLADQGRYRAPSIPDLLVAAAAELAGLTVHPPSATQERMIASDPVV
jgi:predicted nucleic acid-binding protein